MPKTTTNSPLPYWYKEPIVILLNGFKGTGKTTIARELQLLLNKQKKNYVSTVSFAAPLREVLDKASKEALNYSCPQGKELPIKGLTLDRIVYSFGGVANELFPKGTYEFLVNIVGNRDLTYREALRIISEFIGADSVKMERAFDSTRFEFIGPSQACAEIVARLITQQDSTLMRYHSTARGVRTDDAQSLTTIYVFDDYRYPYEAEALRKEFGNKHVIEVYIERDEISNQYIGAEVDLSERMAQDNCRNFAVLEDHMKPPECLYLNMTGLDPKDGAKALASTITLMELAE